MTQFFCTRFGEKLHGVLIIWQNNAKKRSGCFIDKFNSTCGSVLTCGITIKHANNFARTLAINKLDVLRRKCSTKSCHSVSKTSLMHGNNICVALTNYGLRLSCNSLFCHVIGKEVLTFIKDRSVPGI